MGTGGENNAGWSEKGLRIREEDVEKMLGNI
jgi:hypothetical protein